jgi:serpin B
MHSNKGRFIGLVFPWVLTGVLGVACGDSTAPDSTDTIKETRSEKQRITSPQVNDNDLNTQVQGNNAFAFDLYQQIRGEPKNLFYSPHSISLALAMLYGGARNVTEQQMGKALHYILPQQTLHPVLDKLDLELASRGQGNKATDGGAFRLSIVNALWGQDGFSFLPEYLDLLALNYGAGLQLLDFAKDVEGSRLTINDWVEKKTEGRIQDLLPQGSIRDITRMVLTNAIYFNAAWAKAFEEKNTQNGDFHLLYGSTISVPMMFGVQEATYASGSDFQAVVLPYDGGELSMTIIVPDQGKLESVEQSLSSSMIEGLRHQLESASVTLTLPKFEFSADLPLSKKLSALGMVDAFDEVKADLSGIDGATDLFVTDVLHKAFIKVNEKGTEAAAATAVVIGEKSAMPGKSVTLIVDRPFLVLIQDNMTGAILFIGRVLNPSL